MKGLLASLILLSMLAIAALVPAGCGGGDEGSSSDGNETGATYTVYFHIDGYNFDPSGGNMRVDVTYYANGVGTSNAVLDSLPWSSSPVSNIPSGGNAAITGTLTSSYNCNGATVTVSIIANNATVKTGTFACGSNFALYETLP